jgi:hypothetical protein
MSILRGAGKAWWRYVSEVKRATSAQGFDYREQQMLWDFAEEGTLEQWDCISDDDVHGHSMAKLEPNSKGD